MKKVITINDVINITHGTIPKSWRFKVREMNIYDEDCIACDIFTGEGNISFVWWLKSNEYSPYIYDLYVMNQFTGNKISRYYFSVVEEILRLLGASNCYIVVDPDSVVQDYYERLGYMPTSEEENGDIYMYKSLKCQ